MKIIIGLGNPGQKYQNNRHNVGHMFIKYLESLQVLKLESYKEKIKIYQTDCFMNESGVFVKKQLFNFKTLKPSNLIIAHDDLDIPLGKFHIQMGVGPQLHNGLESIENQLKTKEFLRIRIGVDSRTKDNWINGISYVLKDFQKEESEKLEKEIFPKIFEQLKLHWL